MTTDFDQSLLDMTTSSKEQELQAAKAAIAGPIPLIDNPPSCLLTLSRGLYQNQDWQQEIEVRELTGADEESLARIRDSISFFDHVLALGTVRIGSIDLAAQPVSDRLAILQELLIGERQQLLLGVIRVTYGDTKTINITCPKCDVEQEIDLILSEDFKAKNLDDPLKTTYSTTTSKGAAINFRLINGSDQNAALEKKGANIAEQNSIILSRVIESVNGSMLLDPLKFARSMSMRDRTLLLEKLTDLQPGIDLTLKTPCVSCGGEMVLALGWPDLFRP